MIYNGLIDKMVCIIRFFTFHFLNYPLQSQKYYYKSQTYMAAVLRMTQLLSHMFSFTLSLCFIHFPFYPPLYVFILKLCSVFDLFFCSVFLSFSLFPFPFSLFLCCPVVVPGLENGRTITCTHNANVLVPILCLLPFVVVIA